jgi:hypothetical protein
MLRAKRDSLGGPPGSAVESLGEIEGRLFVLRVIAATALTRLLSHRDARGQTELITSLQRAIERKCKRSKLLESDITATSQHAKALLDEALERAGGTAALRR